MIDLDVDALKAELDGIYEERNHVNPATVLLELGDSL